MRRQVLLLLLTGGLVQILLSAYYLSMAHSPRPHDLPVGYVASDAADASTRDLIDRTGAFSAARYPDIAALTDAIKVKTIYGGVDLTGARPHAYLAGAAGPAAATAIRTTFTAVIADQTARQVQQLVAEGRPVPVQTLTALTLPAAVTDVVPLADGDRSGTCLALLVQALVIGASVASTGLGKLAPLTRRSLRRGVGHTIALLAYAAASAAAVLTAGRLFCAIPASASSRTFLTFALLSLAVTGSVAGAVALLGPAGVNLGTLYFLFGLIVSGASILPEFLPPVGRRLGQALPPGAGATAIRDSLYFPAAPSRGAVLVLTAYAGVGLLAVLLSNTAANHTGRPFLLHRSQRPSNADTA